MKTMSDCWVVGRKSDQREFFVILNQKSANLIEINGEDFSFSFSYKDRLCYCTQHLIANFLFFFFQRKSRD